MRCRWAGSSFFLNEGACLEEVGSPGKDIPGTEPAVLMSKGTPSWCPGEAEALLRRESTFPGMCLGAQLTTVHKYPAEEKETRLTVLQLLVSKPSWADTQVPRKSVSTVLLLWWPAIGGPGALGSGPTGDWKGRVEADSDCRMHRQPFPRLPWS